MVCLLVFIVLSVLFQVVHSQEFHKESIVGSSVELPCNITSDSEDNQLRLLAWYKDGAQKAIYSNDFRNGSDSISSSDDRYHLLNDIDSYSLVINDLKTSDSGGYHCLSDFVTKPALKTYVELVVIEPPKTMWIVYVNGTLIASANSSKNATKIISPYYIGDIVDLFCVAFGGKPKPKITWWLSDKKIKNNKQTPLSEHRVRSDLKIGPLEREDQGTVISCLTRNHDDVTPLAVSVVIDMVLPPTLVTVRQLNVPDGETGTNQVKAGEPIGLQCRVIGARPKPNIVWRIDDGLIYNLEQNVTSDLDQNVLTSEVQLAMRRDNDEVQITCCAVSQKDGGELYACSEPLPLVVYYTPTLEILTENSIVNGTISVKKGSCLKMNCSYSANPKVFELIWYHEDEMITKDEKSGSLIDVTLQIDSISESDSGEYVCAGTNTEGSTTSDPIVIDVIFPPYCTDSGPTEYGLAENDTIELVCNTKGNPQAFAYRWILTADIVNASSMPNGLSLYTTVETEINVLQYKRPVASSSNTVLCWGINMANVANGEPCVFWVTDETEPRPPKGCVALRSLKGVSVTCKAGYDGGLPQTFMLTVQATDTDRQLITITNIEPTFLVQEPTDENFKFLIRATNKKGESDVVEIEQDDIRQYDVRIVSNTVQDITTLSLSLCGGVAMIALAACGLVLCAHARGSIVPRRKSCEAAIADNTDESNCETCQNSDDGSDYRLHRTDSFRKSKSSKKSNMRRTKSFHSPRCLNDDNEPFNYNDHKYQTCRVHSMQNISRKRDLDALSHIMTSPTVDSYNYPQQLNSFYTIPRKNRHKAQLTADQTSEITQNSEEISLPPPPEEFTSLRVDTRLREAFKPTPMYSTIRKKDIPERHFTGRSSINTIGLPANESHSIYSYPNDGQVNNNPFDD